MVEHMRSEMSLPHGTVTFLFTDIEGSTRLLQELGDEYADVLAGHSRVLREAFARHGGSRWAHRETHSSSRLRRRPTRWQRQRGRAKRSPTD
jgi:hypothetical protein